MHLTVCWTNKVCYGQLSTIPNWLSLTLLYDPNCWSDSSKAHGTLAEACQNPLEIRTKHLLKSKKKNLNRKHDFIILLNWTWYPLMYYWIAYNYTKNSVTYFVVHYVRLKCEYYILIFNYCSFVVPVLVVPTCVLIDGHFVMVIWNDQIVRNQISDFIIHYYCYNPSGTMNFRFYNDAVYLLNKNTHTIG